MALPKLTRLELQIMEMLWSKGPCSIREIQEAFPERDAAPPPAYTTVQTIVYRLGGAAHWEDGERPRLRSRGFPRFRATPHD
jgi:hypothetical protein